MRYETMSLVHCAYTHLIPRSVQFEQANGRTPLLANARSFRLHRTLLIRHAPQAENCCREDFD